MDAPILRIEMQRTEMDCGIATLAMLSGHTYEEVLVAAANLGMDPLQSGMTWVQMKRVARRLGFSSKIQRKRAIDIENDIGILCVSSPKWKADHVVVLREGLIIDTDCSLWDPVTFLAAQGAKVMSLLVLEPIASEDTAASLSASAAPEVAS